MHDLARHLAKVFSFTIFLVAYYFLYLAEYVYAHSKEYDAFQTGQFLYSGGNQLVFIMSHIFSHLLFLFTSLLLPSYPPLHFSPFSLSFLFLSLSSLHFSHTYREVWEHNFPYKSNAEWPKLTSLMIASSWFVNHGIIKSYKIYKFMYKKLSIVHDQWHNSNIREQNCWWPTFNVVNRG
jgi:hypothetical protein